MKLNRDFENLLANLSEDEIVGLGNPKAKILFIGKEPGADVETNIFHGTLKSWKENRSQYGKRYIPEKSNERNLKHTWQRYQKLYDYILNNLEIEGMNNKTDKYEITFVENVFTTELSNLHAKGTIEAKKQINFSVELEKRKSTFFRSRFIAQFPIVLIFASDNKYIETYSGEVCELFNVKSEGKYDYPGKDPIWIHSAVNSNNSPKLLIHTRQLTNSISKDLIPTLSKIIANFMKENNLNIITK